VSSVRGAAYIVGAFEHPERRGIEKSSAAVHAEVAAGALADAGLSFGDVDGYFCAGDAPGGFASQAYGAFSMVQYLGLDCKHVDTTETGGSSYVLHVGHAAQAIAAGKCNVALITQGGSGQGGGGGGATNTRQAPEWDFEVPAGAFGAVGIYALCAQRHMAEFGTTSKQLAEIKVAASKHAMHNPHALLQNEVTIDEVVESPMISSPLHRLDCCVNTEGGGALVVVSPEVAKSLSRHKVKVLGEAEAPKHTQNGKTDLTYTGARFSGPRAMEEAGVTHADIDYAGIYDSFTITVLMTLEDLGFCEKGQGGPFVSGGALVAGQGKLPVNTDGGGLCNNHPMGRGGMPKVIEAVRQLRGEAHPELQVQDPQIALVHGTGGLIGTRTGAATLILGQEDA
jgi:acetyl-CoA C-acetyltransferase